MTPADRRLLLGVMRWAHSQGYRPRRRRADGLWAWTNIARGTLRVPLPVEARQVFADISGALFVRVPSQPNRTGWAEQHDVTAESVTQAVDLLVALRILPAVFSSAYWSGQSIGMHMGSRMTCLHDVSKAAVT